MKMTNFSYENQGTNTYLVYKIGAEEQIDTMSLGMITNNQIAGFAPTVCVQVDDAKYIKYNVSAKISVQQFFAGPVNRKRLLGVFNGIINAMLAAEEYMIDPNMIMLDLNYIFADVSTCDTILVCLPIVNTDRKNAELGAFFKSIMFSTQFDQTENCDYVAKIINHLNSTPVFSIADFKTLIDNIGHGMYNQGAAGYVSSDAQQTAQQRPNKAQVLTPEQRPTSQQDLGQSIQQQTGYQQMPQQQVSQQQVSQPQAPQPPIYQNNRVNPVTPQQQVSPVNGQSAGNGMNIPGRQGNASPQTVAPVEDLGKPMSKLYLLQHYSKENKAIYDAQQAAKKNGTAVQTPVPAQADNASAVSDEKPMSKLYLLQHYSKENKAIYDAQQAAKKNGGKAVSVKQTSATSQRTGFAVPGNQQGAGGFVVPGQAVPNITPVSTISQPEQNTAQTVQSIAHPAEITHPVQRVQPPQQPVQPVTPVQPVQPVQSQPVSQGSSISGGLDFGETTVLNGGIVGATTVLSGGMQSQQVISPHLIRLKNNEKIPVDKPVFRIGKEKSYVDYFISDNSAISRSHANIVTRDNRYYIVDTNSTNHTYVDGSILQSSSEYEITHGTKLRFANEDFEFRLY